MKTIERKDLAIGQLVKVVLKQDQRSGNLTNGGILRVLTKSPTHPPGIKVILDNGRVSRVKEIVE